MLMNLTPIPTAGMAMNSALLEPQRTPQAVVKRNQHALLIDDALLVSHFILDHSQTDQPLSHPSVDGGIGKHQP